MSTERDFDADEFMRDHDWAKWSDCRSMIEEAYGIGYGQGKADRIAAYEALLGQAKTTISDTVRLMLKARDELAERGGRPTTNADHQKLWDDAHTAYVEAIPVFAAITQRLEKK